MCSNYCLKVPLYGAREGGSGWHSMFEWMSWFDASWWQLVIPCLFIKSRLTIRLFLDKKYIPVFVTMDNSLWATCKGTQVCCLHLHTQLHHACWVQWCIPGSSWNLCRLSVSRSIFKHDRLNLLSEWWVWRLLFPQATPLTKHTQGLTISSNVCQDI